MRRTRLFRKITIPKSRRRMIYLYQRPDDKYYEVIFADENGYSILAREKSLGAAVRRKRHHQRRMKAGFLLREDKSAR